MANRIAVAAKAAKGSLHNISEAIAGKMWVLIQYTWQHVRWNGVKGFAVRTEPHPIGTAEMQYVEVTVVNQRKEVLP